MQSAPTKTGWLVALGVLTLSLVSGLACPGNLDPGLMTGGGPAGSGGGGSSGALPDCPEAAELFTTKCGIPSCHVADITINVAGGLDLQSADPASRLVGVASTGGDGSTCPPASVYLNPGIVAGAMPTGLFVDKLTYATCGDPMPLLVGWNDANTQCMLGWASHRSAAP